MKRTLILCLFLALGGSCGYCDTTFFPPLQPLGTTPQVSQNFSDANASQNINFAKLNDIEQSLFGRSFAGQNISARFSRIERTLFNTTYPSSNNMQRLDNIISNYNQIIKYPNLSNNVLSKMERQVFSQAYPQYNAQKRLERLEQQMLGATQSGDLNMRYERLRLAARNYRPQEYYQSPTAVKANNLLGILGGLGNMGGTMTGFTPPINPYQNYGYGYNNYNRAYNNSYAPSYSPGGFHSTTGMRSPFGFYDRTQDFSTGTGTGVTILD